MSKCFLLSKIWKVVFVFLENSFWKFIIFLLNEVCIWYSYVFDEFRINFSFGWLILVE